MGYKRARSRPVAVRRAELVERLVQIGDEINAFDESLDQPDSDLERLTKPCNVVPADH